MAPERRKVEAVQAFHGWEPGGLNAAIDHAPFANDDLGLDKPQQVAWIVDAFAGAGRRDLVGRASAGAC